MKVVMTPYTALRRIIWCAYRRLCRMRATPSRAELEGGSVDSDSWSSLHLPTCIVHGGGYLSSGTNIHLNPLGIAIGGVHENVRV
jgi:hypothetical protein